MSKKLIAIAAAVLFLITIYFYYEDKKSKKRIVELEQDRLRLILESLQANKDLTGETKTQLGKVAKDMASIDSRVSHELLKALQLIQIDQKEKAIEDLVKVIEHLLRKHYDKNASFLNWLKGKKEKVSLHVLLEYCRIEGQISSVEHKFLVALKEIRNVEAHTIDARIADHLSAAGLVIGIQAIIKLCRLAYPTSN